MAQAAAQGAQLVVLPENFAYFGPGEGRVRAAESSMGQGPIVSSLRRMAMDNRVTLVAGGLPEVSPDPERPFNTALALSAQGEIIGSYRKIHLFDVELGGGASFHESARTLAGDGPLVIDVDGFRCGLSICYDLRFPELYRELVAAGAEVLLVPAAFTRTTGQAHWHVLLRARAIENQCYLVAAAQWGEHPEARQTYGHSLIIDPWGDIVCERADQDGVLTHDLQRARLADVRARLPCLQHRRINKSHR